MRIKIARMMARSGKAHCEVCLERHLLVQHHLNGRDIPDKNRKWNICWICSNCHLDVHSGRIILEGWISTSEGKKLIWRKAGDEPLANEGAKSYIFGSSPGFDE